MSKKFYIKSNEDGCQVKFENSREYIINGKCDDFSKWISLILNPDYFITTEDNQTTFGIQSFFDTDSYQRVLDNFSIRSDIYMSIGNSKLYINAKFYEQYRDNKNYECLDSADRASIEYCDLLFDIFKSQLEFDIFRTETGAILIQLEVAYCNSTVSSWGITATDLSDRIISFLTSIYSDQLYSYDSLCALEIVDL